MLNIIPTVSLVTVKAYILTNWNMENCSKVAFYSRGHML